ncbi:winged helix-turn-helix domain-containing protein [Pseudomonas sp. PDM09]|uniref:winged helix-turn-helix domain-containing protein n=1 Tax=Pseudomonas sp. PDM09 TaxID=2769270 RepID=UPI001780449B|nr:winged helix-turn-helix domain-containing protein [Pseudomonas sp. PDM09]MBD9562560.1 response regulator transcription factor [Pseudomonas sp. PDM09]
MNTPNNSFLIFTRDQLARQAIESLLAQRLYLSFEIESGKLSSERIRKSRFTHILLDQADISLSDVSFIRKNQKDAEIILITPNSESSELHHFSHFGVDGFLKKPVADEEFISAVSRVKESQGNPDIWWFNADDRKLFKEDITIPLTGTESLMLTQLVLSDRRVLSKNDLILRIDKDPDQYSGLEMCLSRLQKKFKTAANGERLVRSVRNRGYCLAQRIRVAY